MEFPLLLLVYLRGACDSAKTVRRSVDASGCPGGDERFNQWTRPARAPWNERIRRQIAPLARFTPIVPVGILERLAGCCQCEWRLSDLLAAHYEAAAPWNEGC
jgi:hypothetical protein